ncbi:hypothetical protein CALCODRAFT_503666 [Calocera cornea HHB12733]|uniref:Uncharacterized protein n=1 Tax=Calocera cornea HHB12733 TaxID=1353952 RepID=A0A165CSK3_9BASI|nr:hypothetical protein CALCODRAFT_503666 [Calocera cornea HHB12733]
MAAIAQYPQAVSNFPPIYPEDTRGLTARCTNDLPWEAIPYRIYDHDGAMHWSLHEWLEAVQSGAMVDEDCVWLEVKVEYGDLHDNTVVYTRADQDTIVEDTDEQRSMEQTPPSGVIVQWEDVVRAVKHISDIRHTVLPLPAKNISYVAATCGKISFKFEPVNAQPLPDGEDLLGRRLSLSDWETNVATAFLVDNRADCDWIEMSFHLEMTSPLDENDTLIGDRYYLQSGRGSARGVAPDSSWSVRGWEDIKRLMKVYELARRAEVRVREVSKGSQHVHEASRPPLNPSPHFRPRTKGLSLRASCGRRSSAISRPLYAPPSAVRPPPSVDFLLKQVYQWANTDQDADNEKTCHWVVVSFQDQSVRPQSSVLWEVYIQTQLGFNKDTSLPEGKHRLPLAELEDALQSLDWSQCALQGTLTGEHLENAALSAPCYVDRTLTDTATSAKAPSDWQSVDAMCGYHMRRLQRDCYRAPSQEPDSHGWLSLIQRWMAEFEICKYVKIVFNGPLAEDLVPELVISKWDNGHEPVSEAWEGTFISFAELEKIVFAIPWAACPAKNVPEPATKVLPMMGLTSEQPVPLQAVVQYTSPPSKPSVSAKQLPPHFSWAPVHGGFLTRERPWHAFVIASCHGKEYRLQPNYRGMPKLAVGPFKSTNEWIWNVLYCIEATSEIGLDWVPVTFWWEEGVEGHTEMVRQAQYFVVTEKWEKQGDSAPIPPGQRIRMADFKAAMRSMRWQKDPYPPQTQQSPIQPPITSTRAANLQQGSIPQNAAPVASASDIVWIRNGELFDASLPSRVFAVASCAGRNFKFYPDSLRAEGDSASFQDVDVWLSIFKLCLQNAASMSLSGIPVNFHIEPEDDTVAPMSPSLGAFFVTARRPGSHTETFPAPPGKRIHWKDFCLAIRKLKGEVHGTTRELTHPQQSSYTSWPRADIGWLHGEVPWHAYIIGFCNGQTRILQPSFPFSSTASHICELDEWLSVIKDCMSSNTSGNWSHVSFFWEEVHDRKINVGSRHELLVVTKDWEPRLEDVCELPASGVVEWENFVDGMKAMTWAPSPSPLPRSRASGLACAPNARQSLFTQLYCWMQQDITVPFSLVGRFGSRPSTFTSDVPALSMLEAIAHSFGLIRGWFFILSSIFIINLVTIYLLLIIIRRRRAKAEATEEGLAPDMPKEKFDSST